LKNYKYFSKFYKRRKKVAIQLDTAPMGAYRQREVTETTQEIVNFDPDVGKNMTMSFYHPTSHTEAIETFNRHGYTNFPLFCFSNFMKLLK